MFGVHLEDIKVGGKPMNLCNGRPNGCMITFDSGTSLMSVPSFAFQKLAEAKVPTAHTFVECSNKNQFGDLTLVIGGKDYVLNSDEWMFDPQTVQLAQGAEPIKFEMGPLGPQLLAQLEEPPKDENMQVDSDQINKKKLKLKNKMKGMKNSQTHEPKQVCASTIMKMDIKKEMFLVGDVFMRKFYTIFDRDNNRVGLAIANTADKMASLA